MIDEEILKIGTVQIHPSREKKSTLVFMAEASTTSIDADSAIQDRLKVKIKPLAFNLT